MNGSLIEKEKATNIICQIWSTIYSVFTVIVMIKKYDSLSFNSKYSYLWTVYDDLEKRLRWTQET